ncbi:hypothetical protein D9757_011381 [Collybiopsis confluens]|uniref:Uncharacterized protein n=1 Tax=Collybiopsis confluens TaxID=2823264 RepID=A0A8H5GLF8_9AGAR|nr:hypothetical protein D9757_011381 [Collybiopsis confluens]
MARNLIFAQFYLIRTLPEAQGGLNAQALAAKDKFISIDYPLTWLNMIIVLLGDLIVAWRAWIFFPEHMIVKITLVVSMVANIGINITDCIFDNIDSEHEIDSSKRTILLDWLAPVLSTAEPSPTPDRNHSLQKDYGPKSPPSLLSSYITLGSSGVFQFIEVIDDIYNIAAAWYPVAVFILINLDSSPLIWVNQTLESIRVTRGQAQTVHDGQSD